MKVYLYGMKLQARDKNNYYPIGYIRDLYLEEMTCDLRDEYYNVLVYDCKLAPCTLKKYGYDFIAGRYMDISKEDVNF